MVNKITPQKAKEIMQGTADYYIVDVRCEDEYEQGHIKGAILLPLCELRCRAGELLPIKNNMLLLYCRSGVRSAQAAQIFNTMGYTDIYNFGGILSWPYEIE